MQIPRPVQESATSTPLWITGLGLRRICHGLPSAAAPDAGLAAALAGALSGPQVPGPSAGRHSPAGNAGPAGAWAGPRMLARPGDQDRPGRWPGWPAAAAGVAAATVKPRARAAALAHRTCPDTLLNAMCTAVARSQETVRPGSQPLRRLRRRSGPGG